MLSAQYRLLFQNFVADRRLPDGLQSRALSHSEMAELRQEQQRVVDSYRSLDNQGDDFDPRPGHLELGPAHIYETRPCPDASGPLGPTLKRAWEASQALIADDRVKIALTPHGFESQLTGRQNQLTFVETVEGQHFFMEIRPQPGGPVVEAAVIHPEGGQGWFFSADPTA